jgi:hypothetical protein
VLHRSLGRRAVAQVGHQPVALPVHRVRAERAGQVGDDAQRAAVGGDAHARDHLVAHREAREDARLGGQGTVQIHHQPRRRGEREVAHVVGLAGELDDEAPALAHGLDPDVAHCERRGVALRRGLGRLDRRGGRGGDPRRRGPLLRGARGRGGEARVAQVDDHVRPLGVHGVPPRGAGEIHDRAQPPAVGADAHPRHQLVGEREGGHLPRLDRARPVEVEHQPRGRIPLLVVDRLGGARERQREPPARADPRHLGVGHVDPGRLGTRGRLGPGRRRSLRRCLRRLDRRAGEADHDQDNSTTRPPHHFPLSVVRSSIVTWFSRCSP